MIEKKTKAYIYKTVGGREKKVEVESLTVFEATDESPHRMCIVKTLSGGYTARLIENVFIEIG